MIRRSPIGGWRDRRATARFLAANPDFASRLDQYEARLDAKALREAPVLDELRCASIAVQTLDDLCDHPQMLATAAPVLMRWLREAEDVDLATTIAWVLRHHAPDNAIARTLLDEFRRASASLDAASLGARSMLAAAVADLSGDALIDDLLEISLTRRYGGSRAMIVGSLARLSVDRPRRVSALVSLLDDDTVVIQALEALARLGAREATTMIEPLLDHPHAVVRSQAGATLRQLTGHPRGGRRPGTAS